MIRRFARLGGAVTLALALALGAAPRPAGAEEVTVVLRAVGGEEPFVFSWIDDKEGKVSIDPEVTEPVLALFAGAQYLVTDQNRVILAHGAGNTLEPVFDPATTARNDAGTFFVAHLRSGDRKLFLDGTVERFRSDPKKGWAQWTLLLVSSNGTTISSVIQQELAFPTPTAPPTPPSPAPDRVPSTRG